MTDPELTVTVFDSTIQAAIIGTDDQGRTIILCPIHHDEAYVEPDGRVVCPTQDAMDDFLRKAMEGLKSRGWLDGLGSA